MRYRPSPSVVAVRVFSISASLEATTATAGTGVPDGSLTEPAIAPCANATAGMLTRQASSAGALIAIAERVKMIFAGRGDGKTASRQQRARTNIRERFPIVW